jgi:hypothetical protein
MNSTTNGFSPVQVLPGSSFNNVLLEKLKYQIHNNEKIKNPYIP